MLKIKKNCSYSTSNLTKSIRARQTDRRLKMIRSFSYFIHVIVFLLNMRDKMISQMRVIVDPVTFFKCLNFCHPINKCNSPSYSFLLLSQYPEISVLLTNSFPSRRYPRGVIRLFFVEQCNICPSAAKSDRGTILRAHTCQQLPPN